jgi:hypothetical protein
LLFSKDNLGNNFRAKKKNKEERRDGITPQGDGKNEIDFHSEKEGVLLCF